MENNPLAFLERYPSGIYKTKFLSSFDGEELGRDDRERFEGNLDRLLTCPIDQPGVINTPEEFFMRWLNDRLGIFPGLPYHDGWYGFELQLPYTKTTLVEGKTFGQIGGLVIASDFAYSDFRSTLVFAINHIPSRRVLVYKDEEAEAIPLDPKGTKRLLPQRIYFGENSEEYPYESLNPLKSLDYTWSLVNLSPDEVYDALRTIGFTWD